MHRGCLDRLLLPIGFCLRAHWALRAGVSLDRLVYVGEALERLSEGRFEIDSLMLLAAGGAAYLGKWAEGSLLLFMFSIGHALENYAMGRAKRAIEALTKLTPPSATVYRNGDWQEVPVEELKVTELVLIKPNERVSADGFVVTGTSSINQAPVTGESVPVDKCPVHDRVQASVHPTNYPPRPRLCRHDQRGEGFGDTSHSHLRR